MKPPVFLWWVATALCAGLGCDSRVETAPRRSPEQPQVRTDHSPVTNEYQGVAVVDPFRWLEDSKNPAVRDWSTEQNRRTREVLDGVPYRPFIQDRLVRLLSEADPDYHAAKWQGGRLFVLKFQPPEQQPVLVTLGSVTNLASERVVVDPAKLDTNGVVAIDWFTPSPDGSLVAVSLSEGGSERGTLRFFSSNNGEPRSESIPRVQAPTGGGSAAWNRDGTGLLYTRYAGKGERPDADLDFYQQVYFHKLGTAVDRDTYELGKELPRTAEIELKRSPDGRHLLASVAHGDGGDYSHYLRSPSGEWRQIAKVEDRVKQAEFGHEPLYIEWGSDEALYLLSHKEARKGCILRMSLDAPNAAGAAVIVPESDQVIADFKPAASGLALVLMKGGPSQFAYLDFFDARVRHVEESTPASIRAVLVMNGDDILFRSESYVAPHEWLLYSPTHNKERVQITALSGESPVSFSDVEVLREKARSKDGTEVLLTVLRKRGTRLDGTNPTILTGYGGFGISQSPNFDVSRRLWLDQGGIIAIANLRGGSEFGEPWHQAGALTNKQNVFDDFAACAEFLVKSGHTSPAKLAFWGGSNGGLLVGAALTQRPDSVRAVVARAGLFDMLRAELDPNGVFNVAEYGTVTHPDQFRALHAYSPYHRVTPNTAYPAVLMLAGENDGRVNPAHSRKMTARLQAASSSGEPILLRTSNSGHGAGTAFDERLDQLTDVYTFLCERLGAGFSQIDRGPWSGGVTADSVVVKVKLVREQLSARLLVSRSESLSEAIQVGPMAAQTEQGNVVAFNVDRLEPDTQYYYAVEVNGQLERKKAGAFRTFPAPGPASFTFAFSGDARTGSTSEVFDRIREHRPLFFMNVGDFHYLDIKSNSPALFRVGYDAVLASPQQSELYRQIPFVYIWDDHDFTGNNSNRRAPAREAARLVYDEYVPHYPLPLARADRRGGPVCQAFSVGRVRFIVTDLRSERDDGRREDDAAKSMMGAAQKAWFKSELLAANGTYPLICWVGSVAWIGEMGANIYKAVKTNQWGYIHHSQLSSDPASRTNRSIGPAVEDWWSAFTTERRELADFVKANRIQGLCILHADAHMLAADDGTNSDYATGGGVPIPVLCAAPLDKEASIKGGPYSQGVYRARPEEGCYGLVTVRDHGTGIDVSFSGRNQKNEEKITLKFTVPAAPGPVASRGKEDL
ncbi:MAG: prolyl oligopeptidase family serine peptidase [Verrucomicrobiia bacterium]